MSRTLKRAALAAMVAGGLIGGLAGSATPIAAGGGCQCTISGSGKYNCNSPSQCLLGNYKCEVVCAD